MADNAIQRAPRSRTVRRAALLVLGIATLAFLGLQVVISGEMGYGNACGLTPPGYVDQEVISVERHLFYYECVLDPHNGESSYTVRRPWQDVRGL
ncbi:hypothetical protein [Nocardioides dongkuii]|uniref:hypothetical protein n=1 Tax=Nocardioides dongkuii TaxID=2760089 RepID=UPI001878EAD0|nr:hypothetical protein [Nocardioides dongkuii]